MWLWNLLKSVSWHGWEILKDTAAATFLWVVWRITILFVWVLCAHDGASAKHHLVLCQSTSLVWEDVFDLPQVLRDVQGLALDAAVGLFIVQIHVISDEEDLADLHQLNGDVEGDGNQDLNGGKRRCRPTGEKKPPTNSG